MFLAIFFMLFMGYLIASIGSVVILVTDERKHASIRLSDLAMLVLVSFIPLFHLYAWWLWIKDWSIWKMTVVKKK